MSSLEINSAKITKESGLQIPQIPHIEVLLRDGLNEVNERHGSSLSILKHHTSYLYLRLQELAFVEGNFSEKHLLTIQESYKSLIPLILDSSLRKGPMEIQDMIRSSILCPQNKDLASCWSQLLAHNLSNDFFKPEGAVHYVARELLIRYPVAAQDFDTTLRILAKTIEGGTSSGSGRLIFHGYPSAHELHQTYGSSPVHIGIGDLELISLTAPTSSATTCLLIQAARHCTMRSDSAFFQNRQLAISVKDIFPVVKEAVHYQHKDAPKLVKALIAMHDAQENAPEVTANADREYLGMRRKLMIEAYRPTETPRTKESLLHLTNYTTSPRPIIDALRMIDANYDRPQPVPSLLKSENADQAKTLQHSCSPDFLMHEVEAVLRKVNQKLTEAYATRRLGTDPRLLDAVLWCDLHVAKELTKVASFENQQTILATAAFREIVKFLDLTCSSKGDQNFCSGLVDTQGFKKIGRMTGQHLIENLKDVDGYLRAMGRSEWLSAIWSTNLCSKVLDFVTVPRLPESRIGERLAQEAIEPAWTFPNWKFSE